MRPLDTSETVARRRREVLRALTPEQRFEIAWDLSLFLRELTFAGLRERNPNLSRQQIIRKYLEVSFPEIMGR